jgi:nitroreductase
MNVSEAIASRHSVRAFLDRPVDKEVITSLLERAKWAPSGGNLQPWRVYVLGGEKLADFKTTIRSKLLEHPMGEGGEYHIYPPGLKEPYRSRRYKCGEELYASIGIARDDKLGRLMQLAKNFSFFGAPVGMFFVIDRTMQEGQWSDLGMFIQTLMLLAREEGLHSCAQEAWSVWPKSIAEFLDIPGEFMLFCGLALGYKDESHAINRWRTERAPLEEFVEWHGL